MCCEWKWDDEERGGKDLAVKMWMEMMVIKVFNVVLDSQLYGMNQMHAKIELDLLISHDAYEMCLWVTAGVDLKQQHQVHFHFTTAANGGKICIL